MLNLYVLSRKENKCRHTDRINEMRQIRIHRSACVSQCHFLPSKKYDTFELLVFRVRGTGLNGVRARPAEPASSHWKIFPLQEKGEELFFSF